MSCPILGPWGPNSVFCGVGDCCVWGAMTRQIGGKAEKPTCRSWRMYSVALRGGEIPDIDQKEENWVFGGRLLQIYHANQKRR